MTGTITHVARLALVAGAAVVALIAMRGIAMAQDTPDTTTQLAALAREARTPSDHARVAKSYRLQAESFEAKAAEHEARVEKLTKHQPPIANKWPSMVSGDIAKAKRQVVDARRAALESRQLADRHLRLSVEAQAETNAN